MTRREFLQPGPLYAIADAGALGVEAVHAAVVAMAEEGLRTIQLRAKEVSDEILWSLAETCVRALEGSATQLWLDDRADVAALLRFRGLHLGQLDIPVSAARQVLGESVAIGLSTHDEGQLLRADGAPEVDLIAFGPIFPTLGKQAPDPVLGLDRLRAARRLTSKPLVAIGGIGIRNLGEVLATGVDAVVVLGAVCHGDVRANCRRLLAAA
jgi:thiamine-phosphate pyrophosphorylase